MSERLRQELLDDSDSLILFNRGKADAQRGRPPAELFTAYLLGYTDGHQMNSNTPQPPPSDGKGPAIWDLVMADMRERDAIGHARYETRLRAHNGRDALTDAYQEALDLAVYLRQVIYERDGR